MLLIQYASDEKLRGGFYTPKVIVDFVLRWAFNGNPQYDILEPSCGDGAFLRQIKNNKYSYNNITAIELEESEAAKAKLLNVPRTTILNRDFFKYCNSTKDKFDLIIGNPPYIRYQYFDKDQRKEAELISSKAGLKYSKLTNAWVSFIIGASLLLKDKGKIGFILPAEVLQVTYAKQLRVYLSKFFHKINIISFQKLVFPDVQQEVVLLLCEKNSVLSHNIEHIEVRNVDGLNNIDINMLKNTQKKIDFKSNKWTFYFLDQKEINFIQRFLSNKIIGTLGDYAKVEVGITTGSNEFFTVPYSKLHEYNLTKYAKPLVGRSVQVPSLIFSNNDWKENSINGNKSYLLLFPTLSDIQKNRKAMEYLSDGQKNNVHKYYKCTIRDEWYRVPSAWVSEALFIRRNNMFPRLIINEAKAFTTDTMHRVTIKKDKDIFTNKEINIRSLVASYYNSLSFAFSEICGRSHGGGVLELMPNEVENIILPYKESNSKLINKIDHMMRVGEKIDHILDFTDKIILKEGYGLPSADIKIARSIWKKLQQRRLMRSKL